MFQNIATGNAHVGTQNLEVHGGVHIGDRKGAADSSLADALAELRKLLHEAYQQQHLNKAIYTAANAEVTAAGNAPDPDTRKVALKRLLGLVSDISHLASAVTTILALVGATS
jgi:hypothetical protein